jgi:hypothetical protein
MFMLHQAMKLDFVTSFNYTTMSNYVKSSPRFLVKKGLGKLANRQLCSEQRTAGGFAPFLSRNKMFLIAVAEPIPFNDELYQTQFDQVHDDAKLNDQLASKFSTFHEESSCPEKRAECNTNYKGPAAAELRDINSNNVQRQQGTTSSSLLFDSANVEVTSTSDTTQSMVTSPLLLSSEIQIRWGTNNDKSDQDKLSARDYDTEMGPDKIDEASDKHAGVKLLDNFMVATGEDQLHTVVSGDSEYVVHQTYRENTSSSDPDQHEKNNSVDCRLDRHEESNRTTAINVTAKFECDQEGSEKSVTESCSDDKITSRSHFLDKGEDDSVSYVTPSFDAGHLHSFDPAINKTVSQSSRNWGQHLVSSNDNTPVKFTSEDDAQEEQTSLDWESTEDFVPNSESCISLTFTTPDFDERQQSSADESGQHSLMENITSSDQSTTSPKHAFISGT